MGKALIAVVFLGFFVIFLIVKFVLSGAKAAYEAVFDPNAKDDRARRILENCFVRIAHTMSARYDGNPANLRLLIAEMVPKLQAYIFDEGYKVPSQIAQNLVCRAIVVGRYATEEEVASAVA